MSDYGCLWWKADIRFTWTSHLSGTTNVMQVKVPSDDRGSGSFLIRGPDEA